MNEVPLTVPAKTSPKKVSFRRYALGDIPACARLAREAWPAGPTLGSGDLELAGMEGYMQHSLDSSNWADIACTDEGVVGFLFGRIDGYLGAAAPRRSPLGEVPSLMRSVLGHDRAGPRLLSFVWSLALTEFKLKLNMPKSDASVEMFIVGSPIRGMGVGSELLDRFLSAAREAGSSLVTVYTDDKVSDWQFYEKRGFRRVGTFHDNITSHYSGVDARGIIFALDLQPVSGALSGEA